ncbi:hypothetical protein ACIA8C_06200 [Nocardia sp. NPDC051321]|uniref:hypothetical protein n=1 Tax=Nocardia sp. NPDC051321 TaxID=3364323 RepID=UPI00379A19BD
MLWMTRYDNAWMLDSGAEIAFAHLPLDATDPQLRFVTSDFRTRWWRHLHS